jgi:FkbM family methyltransferase
MKHANQPIALAGDSPMHTASGTRRIEKNGCSWWIHDHHAAFWDRVEQGTWEPLTYAVFDRFLDGDHSCLDIGAWIGPTALYAACRARHCFAIEPDPLAFAQLRANVALNPPLKPRMSLSSQCLAPACGPVRLGNKTSSGGDSMSSLLFADSAVGWQTQGVTIERFLAENAIDDCSFIKMDIEGGEFDVLPAMAAYLAAQHPTLYLSLHPRFLPDAASRLPTLQNALSCYPHIFTPDFHPVSLETLSDPANLDACYELVFSNSDC